MNNACSVCGTARTVGDVRTWHVLNNGGLLCSSCYAWSRVNELGSRRPANDIWPSQSDLAMRIGLARALIGQREHTAALVDSIGLALDGASVEEIRRIEQQKAGST